MDRKQIIFYLRNPDADKRIWEEIHFINKELNNIEEEKENLQKSVIYSTQVKPQPLDTVKVKTSNKNDLGNVLIQAIEFTNNYEKDFKIKLTTLFKQLDDIKRINLILGTLDDFPRQIVQKYYQEDLTYRSLEREFNMCASALHKKIQDITDDIVTYFNSSYTNEELARINISSSSRIQQSKNDSNTQIDFNKYLESDDTKK